MCPLLIVQWLVYNFFSPPSFLVEPEWVTQQLNLFKVVSLELFAERDSVRFHSVKYWFTESWFTYYLNTINRLNFPIILMGKSTPISKYQRMQNFFTQKKKRWRKTLLLLWRLLISFEVNVFGGKSLWSVISISIKIYSYMQISTAQYRKAITLIGKDQT